MSQSNQRPDKQPDQRPGFPLWLSVIIAFLSGYMLSEMWPAMLFVLMASYITYIVWNWRKHDDKLVLCLPPAMIALGSWTERMMGHYITSFFLPH